MRNQPVPFAEVVRILEMAERGMSSAEISRITGRADSTIGRIRKENGLSPADVAAQPQRIRPELPRVLLDGAYVTAAPSRLHNRIDGPDRAAELRDLYCAHTDACLDYTADRDWQSFSCRECPLFRRCSVPKDIADGWFRRPEMTE